MQTETLFETVERAVGLRVEKKMKGRYSVYDVYEIATGRKVASNLIGVNMYTMLGDALRAKRLGLTR